MRPASIVNFERIYLGVIVLGLINAYISWDHSLAVLAAQPVPFGAGFLIATIAASVAIQLLLWFFIAHRRSALAKWILVVLVSIGVMVQVLAFVTRPSPLALPQILTIAATVLQIAAVWMLVRRDAVEWFGRRGEA